MKMKFWSLYKENKKASWHKISKVQKEGELQLEGVLQLGRIWYLYSTLNMWSSQ